MRSLVSNPRRCFTIHQASSSKRTAVSREISDFTEAVGLSVTTLRALGDSGIPTLPLAVAPPAWQDPEKWGFPVDLRGPPGEWRAPSCHQNSNFHGRHGWSSGSCHAIAVEDGPGDSGDGSSSPRLRTCSSYSRCGGSSCHSANVVPPVLGGTRESPPEDVTSSEGRAEGG